MSNFFEQELRKLFEDGKIIQDPKFVGRVCLGDLGGSLRVRAEFVTTGYADHYEALRLTVLKRTEGEVDRLVVHFNDVIDAKQVPDDPNFSKGASPYIWDYHGETKWYAFHPTAADYQALRQAAGDYLDVFRERGQEREHPAPIRKSPGRSVSRKEKSSELSAKHTPPHPRRGQER